LKIAISTSGGDAPGLNAVIRAATTAALGRGHTVVGLRNGFESLLTGGEPLVLDDNNVEGIERSGGTILGAASSGKPFGEDPDAGLETVIAAIRRHGIDAMIMAGGDGTSQVAYTMHKAGIRVVVVPKTIDRDVPVTDVSFGFWSAVQAAVEALDRLHTTTASHDRLMVVEVMGRDSGWLALYSGIAGGACGIALPEIPYSVDVFAAHILERESRGRRYHIVVCAEGAVEAGGDHSFSERTGKYTGQAERLASRLAELTGKESRSISLGHLLRGGAPSVFDRVLGVRFGSAAVSALDRGESGVMIAFNPPGFRSVPLESVVGRTSRVTEDVHEIRTALNMGISFGG
jgi:ATP-dependent phosphofructokinase / diphosphate-dependent phosphofructokinase